MSSIPSATARECYICRIPYDGDDRVPVSYAPCFHSLCETCLTGVMNSRNKTCPTCRSTIQLSGRNYLAAELIAEFAANTAARLREEATPRLVLPPEALELAAELDMMSYLERKTWVLCAENKFAEALQILTQQLFDPQLSGSEATDAPILIGSIHRQQGRYQQAVDYLTPVVCDLNRSLSHRILGNYELGLTYSKMGKHQLAILCLQEVIDQLSLGKRKNNQAKIALGISHVEMNNSAIAIPLLGQVLNAKNLDAASRAKARLYLGIALSKEERIAESRDYLSSALKDPSLSRADAATADHHLILQELFKKV